MSWKETAAALALLQREGWPRIEHCIAYRSTELDGMTVRSAEVGKHGHILDIWSRAARVRGLLAAAEAVANRTAELIGDSPRASTVIQPRA
jgi:hypothetical protein